MSGFAPILVSDRDPRFGEVSGRYSLEGFPTVIFAKADGTELARVVGAVPAARFRAAAGEALRTNR